MLEGLMHGCWLRGIRLSAVAGQLHIDPAPAGVLTAELEQQLGSRRAEILEWLGQHPDYFAARPLTDNEQALWFLQRMAPQSCAYNIGYGVRLKAQLVDDTIGERLERAWQTVQGRYPQLCAAFAERDGQAVQWDRRASPQPLQREEFREPGEAALQRRVRELADRPFDLQAGEVSRAVLLTLPAPAAPVLVLAMHHIVSDLETFYVVANELVSQLQGETLKPVDPQAYYQWCSELRLRSDEGESAKLDWWRIQLGDAPPLELPCDFAYGSSQDFQGGELSLRLPDDDAQRLRGVARSLGVTPYIYWFALFQQFLCVISGQDDFVLGTPSGWRLKRAQMKLPGYLVNPLPIRCRVRPELSTADWAQAVSAHFKEAIRYRNYPFSRLVKHLDLPRQMGRAPVFQHMFTLNRERSAPFEQHVERLLSEQRGAAHELNLVVIEEDLGFLCKWRYSEALYRRQTVQGFCEQFIALVQASLEQPELPIEQLSWLKHEQRAQLQGESLTPAFADAWQGFVTQVRQRPEATAIEDAAGTLSYRQLAAEVLRRSDAMQQAGVRLGERVALCLPRSRELIMHMLGTWQLGATYIALDPKWPEARQQAICNDARPRVWVSAQGRPDWLGQGVHWQDVAAAAHSDASNAALRPALPGALAAYVVYTSGSTGQPKGVEVSQSNLMHYVTGVLQRLQLSADASLGSLASCATDLGHTALFGALLSGRSLRLLDEELAFDAEELADTLQRSPLDMLKVVPSHLGALLVASQPQRLLPRQCLVVGGEALSAELVERVRALAPHLRIINHYGPSETTVGVLTHEVVSAGDIALGRPLANVAISVRSPGGIVLPKGVSGELWVEGPTVALGYLQAPAVDQQRFGEHGYRTGDRVRLDHQGRVQFLGRLDEQVKIRGYRVEPGEIAGQLRGLAGVSDARVLNVPQAPGNNRLVAFVVADAQQLPAIQQALGARLPDYMQPAQWLVLDALPLLANGKVDNKALLQHLEQAAPIVVAVAADAPGNDVEQRLLEIAAEILGKPDLRLDDNFFAVGGDSILSLQIIARARQQGLKLMPKQIFEFPSVRGWAGKAVDLSKKAAIAPRYVLPAAPFALAPIQQWYFDHQEGAPQHWNQSLLLNLTQPLDRQRFEQAAQALLTRHASLRLIFQAPPSSSEDWQQRYQNPDELAREHLVQVIDEPVNDALIERCQTGLQLDRAPLIRWIYFSHSQQLLCTAHHLIVDSVSWQILLPELEALYQYGPDHVLPTPSASFHQWCEALQAQRIPVQEQQDYWREQLSGESPVPQGDNLYGTSRTLDSQLSREQTQALLGDCHDAYGTQVQDLLLAALADVIGNWLGRDQLTVELESHGRSAWEQAPDLSASIGWHTSRYPLLLTAHDDPQAAVIAAKEALRRVPQQGIGYGLLRQQLGGAGLLSFNYLGRVDQWLAASQLWHLARPLCPGMRAADSRRSHWLDVNALILDGQLHIEWRYAPQAHEPALLRELARQFIQRLETLIGHCQDPAAGRATAADFADSGLSDDEFMGLLEQL